MKAITITPCLKTNYKLVIKLLSASLTVGLYCFSLLPSCISLPKADDTTLEQESEKSTVTVEPTDCDTGEQSRPGISQPACNSRLAVSIGF